MNAPYHSPEMALLDALRAAGLTPVKPVLSFDGKVCRFDIEGRKRGKKHGWFVGGSDGADAWGSFGDWANGYQQTWSLRNRQALDADERAKLDARMAESRADAEAERERMAAATAERATKLWAKGRPVDATHGYLKAKGIIPYGALQIWGMLLIPLRIGNKLTSLQTISQDGTKTFMTGGKTKGASVLLGQLKGAATVLLCEGWATGCTLHQATGFPVVVAFNAGNMSLIAERLHKALDASVSVLVCGDNDASDTGQQAANKAVAALFPRGSAIIPTFDDEQRQRHLQATSKEPSDFNDLHQLAGLDAVTACLAIAEPTDEESPGATSETPPSAEPTPTDEDAYLRHLAGLKPLAYARVRKAAAEALGNIPVGILDKLVNAERKELKANDEEGGAGGCILFDEVEPWPVDVDGAAVLDAAFALLRQYVITDKETLRAAALWASMTWFTEYATVLPLAVITAPEKNCGKSTLLNALAKLSCRPLSASNITPAALFRAVEAWRPTLMIDEADTFAKDNEELRGVLNAGHTRDTATVVRVVEIGGELQPRAFSVWGAKALAGIGGLPDTIMSRAVVLTMRRKQPGERADVLRHADFEAFHVVKRQFARWADDMGETFAAARPDVGGLSNRAADNWEPLLALADLAGGDWPKWARLSANKLTGGEEEAPSINEELLRDIRAAFDRRKTAKLWTTDLLQELCADDEAPWATFNFRQNKPISARQLSKRLSEFDIKPKDIKERFEVRKGYRLEDFTDAFARYLDVGGSVSATALPANNGGAFRVADSDLEPVDKTLSATSKPAPNKAGSGVADRTPLTGQQEDDGDEYEVF